MLDDFTKQLQENAVDKDTYYQQQEKQREEHLKAKENRQIDLYKEIIERTKVACLEAVKQGNYEIDNTRKKLVGTLAFYYQYYDDADDSFGINCLINEKLYFTIDNYHAGRVGDYNGTIKGLSPSDILFLVRKTHEVDVSNAFDKLRNKKRITYVVEDITDSKKLQYFMNLFQTSINNSKIIDVSEIPSRNYRISKHAVRKLNFEIIF